MKHQKTILTYSLILCICSILIFNVNAQQFAEIPRINSKIIVDGYADNVWNLLEEHPTRYLHFECKNG